MPLPANAAAPSVIACLGPVGSFSYLLTEKRFPGTPIEPLVSVGDVFDFLATQPHAEGIVPIENSSGGFIIDTVDRLVDDRCPLWIQEELTLDVKLALLGHSGSPVDVIYSHPMPFFHADEWLKAHYPTARRVTRPSTAASAELAAAEPNAATIGPRQNAVHSSRKKPSFSLTRLPSRSYPTPTRLETARFATCPCHAAGRLR